MSTQAKHTPEEVAKIMNLAAESADRFFRGLVRFDANETVRYQNGFIAGYDANTAEIERLTKERDELKQRASDFQTEILQRGDKIEELKSLNASLLEALKDVAASKSIMVKLKPSEIETKEIFDTFERVRQAIANAEKGGTNS